MLPVSLEVSKIVVACPNWLNEVEGRENKGGANERRKIRAYPKEVSRLIMVQLVLPWLSPLKQVSDESHSITIGIN